MHVTSQLCYANEYYLLFQVQLEHLNILGYVFIVIVVVPKLQCYSINCL